MFTLKKGKYLFLFPVILITGIIIFSSGYAQNANPALFPKSSNECLIVWQDSSTADGFTAQFVDKSAALVGQDFPIYSNESVTFNASDEYLVSRTYDYPSNDNFPSSFAVKAKIYHTTTDTTTSFLIILRFWPECGTGFLGYENIFFGLQDDFFAVNQFDGEMYFTKFNNSGENILFFAGTVNASRITGAAAGDESALIIWFNSRFNDDTNTLPYGIYATNVEQNGITADSILIRDYSYIPQDLIWTDHWNVPSFQVKSLSDTTYQLFVFEPDSMLLLSYILNREAQIKDISRFPVPKIYEYSEEITPVVRTLNISNFSENSRALFLSTSLNAYLPESVTNYLYYFNKEGVLLNEIPVIDTTQVFARDYFQFKTGTETFLNPSASNNEIFIDTYDNFSLTGSKKIGIVNSVRKIDHLKPDVFSLKQNYPNPFNSKTVISFNLPKSEQVELSIYNNSGQKIKTVLNKNMSAGLHRVTVDLNDFSSGLYFYKLKSKSSSKIKKMLLIK
jgi:hypothetical protein